MTDITLRTYLTTKPNRVWLAYLVRSKRLFSIAGDLLENGQLSWRTILGRTHKRCITFQAILRKRNETKQPRCAPLELIADLEQSKYQNVEWRLSIYGR